MTQWIGGPGVPLPPSGPLYPAQLFNAPPTFSSNFSFSLAAAAKMTIPAGEWVVNGGVSSAIEWFDGNITGMWIPLFPIGTAWGKRVVSDGANFRVANQTLCAQGGIVTAAGSGYVQATTTITAGTGNSTWMPIIGGKVGAITIVAGGTNYTKPPLVFFDAPPNPGVPAAGIAVLSSGAVSSITLTAPAVNTVVGATAGGAGYLTAPKIIIVPDPFDPNINIITPASATCVLTGSGTLTGVIMLNFGQSLATAPTLTVNGAGSSATCTTSPSTVVATANDTITMQRC